MGDVPRRHRLVLRLPHREGLHQRRSVAGGGRDRACVQPAHGCGWSSADGAAREGQIAQLVASIARDSATPPSSSAETPTSVPRASLLGASSPRPRKDAAPRPLLGAVAHRSRPVSGSPELRFRREDGGSRPSSWTPRPAALGPPRRGGGLRVASPSVEVRPSGVSPARVPAGQRGHRELLACGAAPRQIGAFLGFARPLPTRRAALPSRHRVGTTSAQPSPHAHGSSVSSPKPEEESTCRITRPP